MNGKVPATAEGRDPEDVPFMNRVQERFFRDKRSFSYKDENGDIAPFTVSISKAVDGQPPVSHEKRKEEAEGLVRDITLSREELDADNEAVMKARNALTAAQNKYNKAVEIRDKTKRRLALRQYVLGVLMGTPDRGY